MNRGGARPGAGRPLQGNRKTITLSVSEVTVRKANELRQHGEKINRVLELAIDVYYDKLQASIAAGEEYLPL